MTQISMAEWERQYEAAVAKRRKKITALVYGLPYVVVAGVFVAIALMEASHG